MRRPSTVILLALLAVLFAMLVAPRVMHVERLKDRSRKLESEIAGLKRENDRLENELYLLRSDPVYLERVAREKFNKARQGEIVYKVVRPGGEDQSAE